MKALLFKHTRATKNNIVVSEKDCLYNSTAFDILRKSIALDLGEKSENLMMNSKTFTSYRHMDDIIRSSGLNIKFKRDIYGCELDAIITISVTNKKDDYVHEYIIVCSDESLFELLR